MTRVIFLGVIILSISFFELPAQHVQKMNTILKLIASGSDAEIDTFLLENLDETQLKNLNKVKAEIISLRKDFSQHEVMNEDVDRSKVSYVIESVRTREAKEIIIKIKNNKIDALEIKDFIKNNN